MQPGTYRSLGLGLVVLLFSLAVQADGYLRTADGEVVTNAYGECWHTSYWEPSDAVIGCDGKTEPVAVVETTVVPVVVEPVEPAAIVAAAIGERVYFAFDEADLRQSAIEQINRTLTSIPDGAEITGVSIEGYTDPIGTEAYNLGLSERRAQAVERYIVDKRGIPEELVSIRGLGETNLQVSCEGKSGAALIECFQPNRRAVLQVEVR
jgi:OOP family OmpA-OmpF porin